MKDNFMYQKVKTYKPNPNRFTIDLSTPGELKQRNFINIPSFTRWTKYNGKNKLIDKEFWWELWVQSRKNKSIIKQTEKLQINLPIITL